MAEHLAARFYDHAVLNVDESEKKGVRIYDDVTMIELNVRGTRESISYVATEEHKHEYAEAWAAFSGERFAGSNQTPLRVLGDTFTLARCKEFEGIGIKSVEQLAEVADVHIMRLRDGMRAKHMAVAYLEGQALAKTNITVEQVHDLNRRLQELEEQNAALSLNQKQKPGRKPNGEDAQTVM